MDLDIFIVSAPRLFILNNKKLCFFLAKYVGNKRYINLDSPSLKFFAYGEDIEKINKLHKSIKAGDRLQVRVECLPGHVKKKRLHIIYLKKGGYTFCSDEIHGEKESLYWEGADFDGRVLDEYSPFSDDAESDAGYLPAYIDRLIDP